MGFEDNENKYYPGARAVRPLSGPGQGKQFESSYDIPSAELQDVAQRGIQPLKVINQSLAAASITAESNNAGVTAPTQGEWVLFEIPGNHFVIYGHDNSSNQAVNTTAFVEAWTGYNRPAADERGFPVKHNRGISGPFMRVWLRWPAQSGVYANLVFYRFKGRPWISGESAT